LLIRPSDLSRAQRMDGASLVSVGVGRYGMGDFNFSLGVKFG
jgi:hypothetical protein